MESYSDALHTKRHKRHTKRHMIVSAELTNLALNSETSLEDLAAIG